uniref:hypothetical protein n=1 Tax=Pseudomonas syringae TaxID=317 RepID=UPI001E5EC86C|nr:hypothetical protein [Pseudomonas syringae]QOQ33370.1 hypothetical protein [Pseudomonas syringae pv. actinidiae]
MAINRVDGSHTAETLLEKISAEERVGESLAERTKADYARKIQAITRKLHKTGAAKLTPSVLVEHLIQVVASGEIAQSTARSMKAAANFWLAEQAQLLLDSGEDFRAHEEAYQALRRITTNDLPLKTQRTSSTKLKYLPKATLESLTEYSQKTRKALNAGTLVAFLKANILVGLRPDEWFAATFASYLHRDESNQYKRGKGHKLTTSIALVVDNSKTTYGRGNGNRREILLHGISDGDLATLLHFGEIITSFAKKHPPGTPRSVLAKAFFKPLQRTMYEALKRMGHPPKSLPTTYSTRHQAVANAKASGMSDREIAAMFGHISIATAKNHYGKKVNGWMKTSFRPSVESIAAVPGSHLSGDNAAPTTRTAEEAAEWIRMKDDSTNDPSNSR